MTLGFQKINGFALIGMDVQSAAGKGLAAFGRQIFRGLPFEPSPENGADLVETARLAALQACQDADISQTQVVVFCLSPGLSEKFIADQEEWTTVDLSMEPDPLGKALQEAADLLGSEEADAVLLVEGNAALQAGSAAVIASRQFARTHSKHTYGVITGASGTNSPANWQSYTHNFSETLASLAIQIDDIGLLECANLSTLTENQTEMQGLLQVFPASSRLTCALGQGLAGLLGLIKTAWCLYNRVIPALSQWPTLENPLLKPGSSFYACSESRTWFLEPGQTTRQAVFDYLSADGRITSLFLREEPHMAKNPSAAPAEEPFFVFPLAAESSAQLIEEMTALQSQAMNVVNLKQLAYQNYLKFLMDDKSHNFRVCLLAHTTAEMNSEIGFAIKGIPSAIERKADWQTPLGSYFTPQPLGKTGEVSFIYPGGFNSYLGIGRDLFYLFPNLLDRLSSMSSHVGDLINEKILYPRSQRVLSGADLEKAEMELNDDPLTLMISGSTLAVLYNLLLQETFELNATSGFGYSLGEISMMFASGAWTQADEISHALRTSPLFQTRLSGPQNAVREFWQMPLNGKNGSGDSLWSNHVIMTDPEKLKQAMGRESRVYLTHINTPRQFVIAGEPEACRRVIDELKCSSLKAPFNFALHCDAIQSEYDALTKLHTWQVNPATGMKLYSSATYQTMPMETESAARQIAAGLCKCVDFPRLVRQAYSDNARIFIELGAGSNCARWIDETLKDQPHASFSINRKGADDHTSILRLLARLVCHQTRVNLQPLFM
jgi:PfaB family protein